MADRHYIQADGKMHYPKGRRLEKVEARRASAIHWPWRTGSHWIPVPPTGFVIASPALHYYISGRPSQHISRWRNALLKSSACCKSGSRRIAPDRTGSFGIAPGVMVLRGIPWGCRGSPCNPTGSPAIPCKNYSIDITLSNSIFIISGFCSVI